ncbi:hypothetical protein GH714_035776 [Hevea brasiliensis]|uniref:CCHC-type domain-containing protein n=1 Tax=Hevea brasiliensis TaxID=3981 RepID=A0A6A6KF56_HEVBR|nr:hypothetical protein GH714_035776 [Hevea brasiliensis]
MCMEAYLQGQDLWDLVEGVDVEIPADTPENSEPRRKWKIKCGKALFALRTSISKEFIDHVLDISSPKEVWETLERLFSKKNTARLQLLENELAMSTQGEMSIFEYFLRVKSICAEISELDANEKISEARLRRFLIRGLKKEYTPFVTSIQGWAKQPSVEELERNKNNKEGPNVGKAATDNSQNPNIVKCYRCGKIRHIKKNCRVKLSKANVARDKEDGDQLKWEQCFTVKVAKGRDNIIVESTQVQALFNHEICKDEWIIDSGCCHHVTGNDSLLSEVRQHKGERVIVTADNSAYLVAKGVIKIGMDDKMVKLNEVFHVPGEAYVKKTSQTENAATWHARLGHLGYQLLQQISSKTLVDGIPALQNIHEDVICQGCQFVQKTTIQEVTLDGDQENLQLCPENNMEVPIDDEFPASNISNSEDGEQRSKKQATVALSSTEAEYMAATIEAIQSMKNAGKGMWKSRSDREMQNSSASSKLRLQPCRYRIPEKKPGKGVLNWLKFMLT